MRRLKDYSYPKEDIRAREKYGFPGAVAKIFVASSDWPAVRSTAVLIREAIGL